MNPLNRSPMSDHDSHNIRVNVQTQYIAEQSVPADERYVFAYTITISNLGTAAARLMTRHWIITDGNGRVQEVRGDGVVGEQPRLEPGQGFRYTSGAVLNTPVGSMEGRYHMVDDDGAGFDAEIPRFPLRVPHSLH